MSDLHLLAFLVNVVEEPEIILSVGSQSTSGQWWTNEGQQVWPYWTQPLEVEVPPIPDGWIEHLHAEAAKFAATHKAPEPPKLNLLAQLGLGKPKATITRRV